MKEYTQLLKDNLYYLHEDIKLQEEIVQAHEKVRERALDYVYKLVQVFGLIAGFGFTALSFAKHLELWLLGQFILFLSIAYAIFWVKRTFIDEAGKYKKWIKELGKIIEARMQIVSKDLIEIRMEQLKEKTINLANTMKQPKEQENYGTTALNVLLILFVIGTTVILVSFLPQDFFIFRIF
ncbi:MAG: hypothetical protein Q7R99_01325 [bacterium]|nr:hypothetical protein [bacterium]